MGERQYWKVSWASLAAQLVKNPPAMRETWVQSLAWEDPLQKGKAAHSSILAWRVHGLCDPSGLKESDTTERLHFHFRAWDASVDGKDVNPQNHKHNEHQWAQHIREKSERVKARGLKSRQRWQEDPLPQRASPLAAVCSTAARGPEGCAQRTLSQPERRAQQRVRKEGRAKAPQTRRLVLTPEPPKGSC